MSLISTEFFNIANEISDIEEVDSKELSLLIDVSETIGKSWSGSWFGYHSRTYYYDFEVPPPGAFFSQEWGIEEKFSGGSTGDWRVYTFDDVISLIEKNLGFPNCKNTLIHLLRLQKCLMMLSHQYFHFRMRN